MCNVAQRRSLPPPYVPALAVCLSVCFVSTRSFALTWVSPTDGATVSSTVPLQVNAYKQGWMPSGNPSYKCRQVDPNECAFEPVLPGQGTWNPNANCLGQNGEWELKATQLYQRFVPYPSPHMEYTTDEAVIGVTVANATVAATIPSSEWLANEGIPIILYDPDHEDALYNGPVIQWTLSGSYSLSTVVLVEAMVSTCGGGLQRTLVKQPVTAMSGEWTWDGKADSGAQLARGPYYCEEFVPRYSEDSHSTESPYLTLSDVGVERDGVPSPHTYDLLVTRNFAHTRAKEPYYVLYLLVPHARVSQTVDNWEPNRSLGTVTTSLTAEFPLAGDWSVVVLGKDDDADISKNSQRRWSNCGAGIVWIPPTAHFAGDLEFLLTCTNAYGEVGDVHDQLSTVGPTFYSGRYELGTRGGVVLNGDKANAVAALQEDAIFHYSGHCMMVHYPDLEGPVIDCGIEFDTGGYLGPGELASWPSGACSQLRLCFLDACGLADHSVFPCLAGAIADKGAAAVIAFVASVCAPQSEYFDARLWYYMAKDGNGACAACEKAKRDVEDLFGDTLGMGGTDTWRVFPTGGQSGNESVIWPATFVP